MGKTYEYTAVYFPKGIPLILAEHILGERKRNGFVFLIVFDARMCTPAEK